LLATLLEQSTVTEPNQHGIEQDETALPIDEPSPELAQHREVEPRIRQFQAETVFPIDPTADRLPVGQAFDVLENADKG
jgi:hypothetical protein